MPRACGPPSWLGHVLAGQVASIPCLVPMLAVDHRPPDRRDFFQPLGAGRDARDGVRPVAESELLVMSLTNLDRLAHRILGVIILLGFGLVAYCAAPDAASDDFYSVSAQVVPVFLLTLVLETRAFRVRQPETSPLHAIDGWLSVLVFGVFIGAEFSSLAAVATADQADGDPGLVFMAIAMGAFAILAVAMYGEPRR